MTCARLIALREVLLYYDFAMSCDYHYDYHGCGGKLYKACPFKKRGGLA